MELLKELAGGFSANRTMAGRAIRELHERDPNGFPDAAAEVLRDQPEGPGARFLLAILMGHGDYLHILCDPRRFSAEVSTALLNQAKTLDPMIEVKLARMLVTLSFATDQEADFATRVLDVLNQTTGGATALPALRLLMGSSNARVRSKAALLIGRLSRNPQWAKMIDPFQDVRVAANAVESLWGLNTAAARDVFREAAADERSRVAGNGAVGLYLAGDPQSVAILFAFSRSPSARFRTTAAWAMGRTGDPRFLARLSDLRDEPDAGVRHTAATAAGSIQARVKRLLELTAIPVRIHSAMCRQGDHEWHVEADAAAFRPAAGQTGVDFRNFVICSGETLVEEFSVEERLAPPPALHVIRFRTGNPHPATVKVEVYAGQGSGEALGFEMAAGAPANSQA